MGASPRVAIVLAVYKPDPKLFELQLQSLRHQTYGSWFLIVHDDASTDPDLLRGMVEAEIDRDRFVLVRGAERRGAVGNFASALEHVPKNCELIAFCDQDDEWRSDKLERMVREFENRDVMAAHSDLEVIDRDGRRLQASCWDLERRDIEDITTEKTIFRNPITGCSLVFRATLLDLVLPIPKQNPRRPAFFHDAWVALAALERGRIVSVREPLVRYRQHGGNVVGARASSRIPALGSVLEKCLSAYLSRRELDLQWQERLRISKSRDVRSSAFSTSFDFGLSILFRTVAWTFSSKGYLRIGLQMGMGKLFWDMGLRPVGEKQ